MNLYFPYFLLQKRMVEKTQYKRLASEQSFLVVAGQGVQNGKRILRTSGSNQAGPASERRAGVSDIRTITFNILENHLVIGSKVMRYTAE
jgi:hypothetical protein